MNRPTSRTTALLIGLIVANLSLTASAQGPKGIDWEYQIVHPRGVEAVAWAKLLSGQSRYKLRVPAKVPVRDFWSVIAYSKETKAFIYNDADRVGLSSYDASLLKANTDGTVDLYFGKTAPEGLESNWIPTAGEEFFLIFRFYGPEEAVFDKSFKLPDVERINKCRPYFPQVSDPASRLPGTPRNGSLSRKTPLD